MPFAVATFPTQRASLEELARLIAKASVHPAIVKAARAITMDCPRGADECQLEAIYNAVQFGTNRVAELRDGLKYIDDPALADFFTAPQKLLSEFCADGACAADCDEHGLLCGALASAIGFEVGMQAWGESKDELVHVYAVVGVPKHDPPEDFADWYGRDTTTDYGPGWKPESGYYETAIAEAS